MQNFTKTKLSGSTSGMPIKIAATATAGTTIHTARSVTDVNNWDELWVAFTNTDTVARNLTVEYGGVTDPDNLIIKTLSLPPLSRPLWLLEGFILQNGLLVRAFASAANVVLAEGYVIQMG